MTVHPDRDKTGDDSTLLTETHARAGEWKLSDFLISKKTANTDW